MPTYLWSGKSPNGEESAARVEAKDVEGGKAALMAKGWTNLELQKGEIAEYVSKGVASASAPEFKIDLTPQQELKMLKGGKPPFLSQWWDSVVEAKGTLFLLAGCLALSVYRHHYYATLFFGAILVAVIFLFPAIHVWFGAPMKLHQKMHTARTWWRWEEVLQCLNQLQRAHKRTKIGIGRTELARYRALAMAGMGQIDQAIKLFDDEAMAGKMPEWLKASHMSEIYIVGQQFDKALELRRQAVALSNEDAIPCLDLAVYVLDRLQNVDEGKALLAKLETKTIPALGKPFIASIKGMIAWRQGDLAAADRFLRESLQGKEANGKNRYYIYEAGILLEKGRLAIVNAALGNKLVAQQFYAEAHPYLVTTKREDMIAEYNKYMSGAPALQTV